MPLSDSKTVIGAVSELLRELLSTPRTSAGSVSVGRPEQVAARSPASQLNIFLYQINLDRHMRNQSLPTPGQEKNAPQLWLELHYLLTAFDSAGESDTVASHGLLGEGLLALHNHPIVRPSEPETITPDPLHITFEDADIELLSRVMQGSGGHFRLSTAFLVGPVMVGGEEPPAPTVPVLGDVLR